MSILFSSLASASFNHSMAPSSLLLRCDALEKIGLETDRDPGKSWKYEVNYPLEHPDKTMYQTRDSTFKRHSLL